MHRIPYARGCPCACCKVLLFHPVALKALKVLHHTELALISTDPGTISSFGRANFTNSGYHRLAPRGMPPLECVCLGCG
eukprot:1157754-Pelagomonas_calceolata.AAC.5